MVLLFERDPLLARITIAKAETLPVGVNGKPIAVIVASHVLAEAELTRRYLPPAPREDII
jgi:hypothetical protein